MSPKVLLEREAPLARIILNRPEKHNAIDLECLETIERYVADIALDKSINAVIIMGAGRSFCAGGDLEYATDLKEAADGFSEISKIWHRVFDSIESLRVPVIAAVQGLALAGGLELAMVCDFVIVAEDAHLGDQHAQYGIFPGGGATQRLPRLIGERRAKWILMSGEWMTAPQAVQYGLANEIVEPGQLNIRAEECARLLASRSPLLNAAIKETIRLGMRTDLASALALERPRFLQYMASEDLRIGLSAFASRTKPVFVGR